MDVNLINPFIMSITTVLPQLGFKEVKRTSVLKSNKNIILHGVTLNLGIVGDKIGNIVYEMSSDTALKVASTMMMGMPVTEFDDMAKSAVSEMSNMLTANSTINFSNMGINVDISVPSLIIGEKIEVEMSRDSVISIIFSLDGMDFKVHISI